MTPEFVASYLLNAAWQVPVVAVGALLATRFAGLAPGARNAAWLGFLGVAILLPAAALEGLLPHAQATVARAAPDAALAAAQVDLPASSGLEPALRLAPWAAWAMAGVCAVVALAMAIRLARAGLAARRLAAEARPAQLPARALAALEDLARRRDRALPRVLSSPTVAGPAVVGALRPVILIPEAWRCSDDELTAALLHEMAHVLRHDYAVNLACEVLTLPLAWHPAMAAIKAGVRKSRELACDAIAASAMASRKTYAKCLVSLAQNLGAPAPANPTRTALAVGLFGKSDLEDRLMQLMKPRDAESFLVGAARACGLTGVVAGLLGSAALLHVTPVFAQAAKPAPAAAAVPAVPAAPAAPAVAAVPAQPATPAAPATPRHRHGIIYTRNGVTIETGDNGHRHTWTTAEGKTITVTNDDVNEPSEAQRRAFEADARDAEARAAEAEKLVNSPEFKARIAKAKADGEAARQMVNSPEFKARIAKAKADGEAARQLVESPEFKDRIAKAKAAGEAARQLVESPEFKARIEAARVSAAEAEKLVNSAEFKARIARAQASAAEAAQLVNSPEFRARLDRLRRDDDESRDRAIP